VLLLGADVSNEIQRTPVVFRFMTQLSPKGSIQMTNGKTVSSADWPAMINAIVDNRQINGKSVPIRCSGVLVGPGTFLTAAHCLDKGAGRRELITDVFLSVANLQLDAKCTVADEYLNSGNQERPRVSQDFALCTFATSANSFPGLPKQDFEVMNMDSAVAAGEKVLMTGFGCEDFAIVDGRLEAGTSDNYLRVGDATVTRPAGAGGSGGEAYIGIVSELHSQPALCFGDSGGPLFSGASVDDQKRVRRIRGLNSKVDWFNRSESTVLSSIAALSQKEFRVFVKNWADANPTKRLCGFNIPGGTLPCRK
jgi:hypothetical protein